MLRINITLALAALTLVACGSSDNSTTSQNGDEGTVQLYGAKVATSASNLPACDSTQVGQLFYVLADEMFQFCTEKGYESIDLSGIAGTDGTDGKDGTNGTNGTNGADGEDGADGSSCSVIENTNGSKTIFCEDGTTATVIDGANCTVADNGDGSYDLTCSGTTVTVRDGKDGVNGTNGINGTSFHSGVGIPASNVGANGDTYLDTYRTAYYLKISENWVLQSFDVSRSFQDSRDGRLYKKVTIGTQTWMAENLAYLPSVNNLSESSPSEARYYVYNYDGNVVANAKASSDYTSYGVLYNWPAAMAGVCPTGWHLPSDAEWTTLETTVGGAGTAGTKLKSVSGWTTGGGATSTDAYGFSALPSGYYDGSGFGYALIYGGWWTATENVATGAYARLMDISSANVYSGNSNKGIGFSVRCLQD